MLGRVLLLCASAALAAASAGRGLDADELQLLAETFQGNARFSDNITEDANLDVPELVRRYRYPLEVHQVTTLDGYILTIHRISHGRDQNSDPSVNRPIVFLMHGLFASSADWILMGPGSSIAYLLAEAGYDVWLGNARGNYYSRAHTSYDPDAIFNTFFWNFSWDEIGNIDVPAMIDYVLIHTGHQRLHYIGHSQGTTTFFVMASLRPDYNNKIISMHALAPSAFFENSGNLLLIAISQFADPLQAVADLIGLGEFLPNNEIMSWAGQALCRDEVVTQPICTNILFLTGGWNEDQLNATMLPVIFGHTPAGASVKQVVHYGQSVKNGGFRRFDHGWLRNLVIYGSFSPPSYDLARITTPVFLHYTLNDQLVDPRDVDRLFRELGRLIDKIQIPNPPTFGHYDFLWGVDAKELLYDPVINLLQSMDEQA